MSPRKVSASYQCFPACVGKCRRTRSSLSSTTSSPRGTYRLGRPRSPSHFWHLVLEDQVVAERVPRELAREAMVLVEVVARVGEHESGSTRLRSSKASLTVSPTYGMNASRNPWTTTSARAAPARKSSALARASSARVPVRPEHDPRHLEVRSRPSEREERPAAADLDVVGVAADREHASQRRIAAHSESGSIRPASARVPRAADLRQGARPDSCSASSRWRSLIVSIGPKKPSYGNATTSPRGISRANVSSTSSSPGLDPVEQLRGDRRRSRR